MYVCTLEGKRGFSYQHSIHTQPFYGSGFCPGLPGWASTRINIHPLTPIVVINHPLSVSSICYYPWHRPCTLYVPGILLPQSISKFSLVYLLAWHPPLHTPYISSPSHCLLFAAHAHTIATCFAVLPRLSSNPSLSLNHSLGTLSCSLTPLIHLTILISAHWSATTFSFLTARSHFHTTYYFARSCCTISLSWYTFQTVWPIISCLSFAMCFAIWKISFCWSGSFKLLAHSFCFFSFAKEITLFAVVFYQILETSCMCRLENNESYLAAFVKVILTVWRGSSLLTQSVVVCI